MKVAKWYNNQDIRIEEVPTPTPGPDEMLVKVMACGICGLPRAPLVPGHEIGAEVVGAGQAVSKYTPGDRVFVAPKAPCMQCDYCKSGHYPACTSIKERLPGGLAEYVLVPNTLIEHGTYRLPDNISYEQSTFIEPLACVVRAQRLAGTLKQDQTVVVLGCGMSGLLHIKLAKAKKCQVIATDVNRKRLELAAGMGADIILDAAGDLAGHLLDKNGKKADVVILCTSALSAVDQAWQCVDKGGAVVFFAVPGPDKQVVVPLNDFWTREVRILTSYYCGPPDIEDAIDLLTSGTVTVDGLVTHRLPLDDIAKGFQLVLDGQESIKVIINPN
jgi:L-iditol 2-dehydrogenase